jgi:hypothetical protein
MRQNPDLASTWRGRILMQVLAEKTDRPEITHRPLEEDFKTIHEPYMKEHEIEIIVEFGVGISLPDMRKMGMPFTDIKKYNLKVAIADCELKTDKPQYAEGTYNRWNNRQ